MRFHAVWLVFAALFASSACAVARSDIDDLLHQIGSLQKQVAALQAAVQNAPLPALQPSDVKTFSSVLKGALAKNSSQEIECFDLNATGFVTHAWFTIGNGYTARLRFYIDNETTPSLDFDVAEGIGSIGFSDPSAPWGTTLHGKGASEGALFSTRRVPFGNRIRVTAIFDTLPPGAGLQSFFFIIRGLEAVSPPTFPGMNIAGLQLPPNARLRQYTTTISNLGTFDFVSVANASASSAGIIHEVWMKANSSLFIYLEACMRLYVDGAAAPLFLSSGTEDYFNSAMYFDGGPFRFENSGLTHKDESHYAMSAYRIHERDPLVFSRGMNFVWRNSEDPLECPFVFPWPGPRGK